MADDRLIPGFTVGGHLAVWRMALRPPAVADSPIHHLTVSAELLIDSNSPWSILNREAMAAFETGKRVALTLSILDDS